MTDDAAILPPGGEIVRDREELDASFGRMGDAMGQIEVLEYVLDFSEAKVLGDYAFEWGEIRGSMRQRGWRGAALALQRYADPTKTAEWRVEGPPLHLERVPGRRIVQGRAGSLLCFLR